ncbi:resolvase [Pseudomonas cavernicola]|uniref:Resolvase n=1 Tax=Pseudomonas cavernicola TaxID=2320866 RepID=A0A418XJF2_9PSED|nr:recombinase family protein [Pseudomonas cavernicola]RJG12599.1 resolvase [Pseudomonas cavernicola]
MSNARIYLRASTKEQDSLRAKALLEDFAAEHKLTITNIYSENISGTKLDRPELQQLLSDASQGDVLLVESVDRLSRLSQDEWHQLKTTIRAKGLRLVVADLPTSHQLIDDKGITGQIMQVINDMLIDLMATMARLDQDKRVDRIKQGLARRRERGEAIPSRGKSNAWDEVKAIMAKHPELSVEQVAKLAGCGVATVYRVKAAAMP